MYESATKRGRGVVSFWGVTSRNEKPTNFLPDVRHVGWHFPPGDGAAARAAGRVAGVHTCAFVMCKALCSARSAGADRHSSPRCARLGRPFSPPFDRDRRHRPTQALQLGKGLHRSSLPSMGATSRNTSRRSSRRRSSTCSSQAATATLRWAAFRRWAFRPSGFPRARTCLRAWAWGHCPRAGASNLPR